MCNIQVAWRQSTTSQHSRPVQYRSFTHSIAQHAVCTAVHNWLCSRCCTCFIRVPHMIRSRLQSIHRLPPGVVEIAQAGFIFGRNPVRLVNARAALRQPRVPLQEEIEPLSSRTFLMLGTGRPSSQSLRTASLSPNLPTPRYRFAAHIKTSSIVFYSSVELIVDRPTVASIFTAPLRRVRIEPLETSHVSAALRQLI